MKRLHLILAALAIPLSAFAQSGGSAPEAAPLPFSPDGRYDLGKPNDQRPNNIYITGQLFSNGSTAGSTSTATAAGTTTLTASSSTVQVFTGTTTQNVVLPVTSTLKIGRMFEIVNNSTGAVTVKSSGSNTIAVLPASSYAVFKCALITGTSAASWNVTSDVVDGKTNLFDNSLEFAGTDGTKMTFPSTNATIARTDAAQTFTGHNTFEGVTPTGATGTGNMVFSVSPTFTGTPVLGAANATSITYTAVGSGPVLKQGSNGLVGTFVANGASAVTVSNTAVAISDAIIISLNTVGGTVGAQPHLATITAGTGFTVVATAGDTSTYNYALIKNAP
jgi:hypothetical protein